jgi:hypothetical protein
MHHDKLVHPTRSRSLLLATHRCSFFQGGKLVISNAAQQHLQAAVVELTYTTSTTSASTHSGCCQEQEFGAASVNTWSQNRITTLAMAASEAQISKAS